jgi:hypothetical protein
VILINNCATDLLAGFDRMRGAELEIKRKWRTPLLAAYARKIEAFHAAQAQYQRRRRITLAGLGVAVAALCGGGLACTSAFFAQDASRILFWGGLFLTLIAFPAAIVCALVYVVFWRRKPTRPKHPLREEIFRPLLPRWRAGLRGSLPQHLPYEGAAGEYKFIRLLKTLKIPAYIAYRLQQQPGDDLDVTIVGRKGVWLFEVKYWSGEIIWRNGEWSRYKTYFQPGGQQIREARPVSQPPEQQWRRMVADTQRTLEMRASSLVQRYASLSKIHGGVVFSHPEAAFHISSEAPFAWGSMRFWMDRIQAAPSQAEMDERRTLQVMEILLARHQQLQEACQVRSMLAYAEKLIQEAEFQLAEWVGESRPL